MFVIRQITEDDAEGFLRALSRVAAEKKYIQTIHAPPIERVKTFIKGNIEKNYAQYVALNNEILVGWADIIPLNAPTREHTGTLGMGIVAEYRGKRIGTQLLAKTIEHAWATGLTRLELEVFSDNQAAIALYKKHGYIQEGLKKFARCIDGTYQDVLVMAQYCI